MHSRNTPLPVSLSSPPRPGSSSASISQPAPTGRAATHSQTMPPVRQAMPASLRIHSSGCRLDCRTLGHSIWRKPWQPKCRDSLLEPPEPQRIRRAASWLVRPWRRPIRWTNLSARARQHSISNCAMIPSTRTSHPHQPAGHSCAPSAQTSRSPSPTTTSPQPLATASSSSNTTPPVPTTARAGQMPSPTSNPPSRPSNPATRSGSLLAPTLPARPAATVGRRSICVEASPGMADSTAPKRRASNAIQCSMRQLSQAT